MASRVLRSASKPSRTSSSDEEIEHLGTSESYAYSDAVQNDSGSDAVENNMETDTGDFEPDEYGSGSSTVDAVSSTLISSLSGVTITTTIIQLVALCTWNCFKLYGKRRCNAQFVTKITSLQSVELLLSSVPLSFATGLFECLQGLRSPTISFFKTLSTLYRGLWGIYLVLLEKENERPKIYIGSGCGLPQGVVSRLRKHRLGNDEPRFCALAKQKGFRITYMGLLCSSPIPSADKVPQTRLIYLALEAMLSFTMGAMYSTKEYRSGMCSWAPGSLEHDGLCSHSAFSEGVWGGLESTPEELIAQAALRKENDTQSKSESYVKAKENDAGSLRARWRGAHARQRADPVRYESKKAIDKRYRDENKKSKKYFCAVCNSAQGFPKDLRRHCRRDGHRRRVEAWRKFILAKLKNV